MLDSLLSLLAVFAILLCAYAPGRIAVRHAWSDLDPLTTVIWSMALGLLCGGLVLTLLAIAGLLDRVLIALVTIGTALGGAVLLYHDVCEWMAHRKSLPRLKPDTRSPVGLPGRGMLFGALGLALVALVTSLVSALAPPTAGDALCYHLDLPKTFLDAGGLHDLPYDENATYPLLTEMWYLWGLALNGGVAAQLMHWVAGVLLGVAAIELARPILGAPWSLLVGVVVWLVPGVSNQMTAPLNDVALAAFTTLALAAGQRAWMDAGDRRWYLIAGLMWGGAAATKYTALLFVPALVVVVAYQWYQCPGRRRELLLAMATVACVAISVAGVWYLRATWHRGNPVYPFMSDLIGMQGPAGHADKTPLGMAPLDWWTGAWQATMSPERFGGRGHELGPLFLALLPTLMFARRLRGQGVLLVLAAVYCVQWYVLRQNVRFMLPLVPIGAIGVVWMGVELRRLALWPRAIASAAVVAMLALGALFPLLRSRDKVQVALGIESRGDYLERNEPTYRAAQIANQIMTGDARLLSQDYRAFYFDCPVTRESSFRRRSHYDQQLKSPANLGRTLRARGFTHVLLAETVSGPGIQFDPTLRRLVDAASVADAQSAPLRLLAYEVVDTDGARRRYKLLALR